MCKTKKKWDFDREKDNYCQTQRYYMRMHKALDRKITYVIFMQYQSNYLNMLLLTSVVSLRLPVVALATAVIW